MSWVHINYFPINLCEKVVPVDAPFICIPNTRKTKCINYEYFKIYIKAIYNLWKIVTFVFLLYWLWCFFYSDLNWFILSDINLLVLLFFILVSRVLWELFGVDRNYFLMDSFNVPFLIFFYWFLVNEANKISSQ